MSACGRGRVSTAVSGVTIDEINDLKLVFIRF